MLPSKFIHVCSILFACQLWSLSFSINVRKHSNLLKCIFFFLSLFLYICFFFFYFNNNNEYSILRNIFLKRSRFNSKNIKHRVFYPILNNSLNQWIVIILNKYVCNFWFCFNNKADIAYLDIIEKRVCCLCECVLSVQSYLQKDVVLLML